MKNRKKKYPLHELEAEVFEELCIDLIHGSGKYKNLMLKRQHEHNYLNTDIWGKYVDKNGGSRANSNRSQALASNEC